jgi:hypothetical protein
VGYRVKKRCQKTQKKQQIKGENNVLIKKELFWTRFLLLYVQNREHCAMVFIVLHNNGLVDVRHAYTKGKLKRRFKNV